MRGVWFFPIVSLLICKTATSQELVSDEPLTQDQLMATLPVLGLRKLPADKVITARNAEKNEWIFNPTTAVGSALSTDTKYTSSLNNYYNYVPSPDAAFAWLKSSKTPQAKAVGEAMSSWEADYLNKTDQILSDREQFVSNSDAKRKAMLNEILVMNESGPRSDKAFPQPGGKYAEYADPDAVGYILAANRALKKWKNTGGHSDDWLSSTCINMHCQDSDFISDLHLDTSFAIGLRGVYDPLKTINYNTPEISKIAAVSDGIQSTTSDLPIAASVLTKEGDAGIGIHLVFTAVEKNLKVEPSLLRSYDVYWIQLAINPSEELVSRSSELRYDVTIQTPNCLVLSLQPLRVGTEENTTSKVSAPEVKVGDVEVGEMFSRTIEYRQIRPTILGHGVQMSSFGWIFSDDALDASTKKLFAVVGVPKHQKEISTKMSLAAKFKGYFGTNLESDWGSTGPTQFTVNLSP